MEDNEGTEFMSITIAISILPKEANKSEAFLRLLRTLRNRSINERTRLREIISGNEEDNSRFGFVASA